MKVLILGGDGMLGHEVFLQLRADHEARVTLRQPLAAYASQGLFDSDECLRRGRCARVRRVERVLDRFPAASGGQRRGHRQAASRSGRSDHEHRSEFAAAASARPRLAASAGARLIHLSTDCVFTGERGNYSESDKPDAADLYGARSCWARSPEQGSSRCRTSMIGLGLYRKSSLVDWFLAQKGRVQGYRHAIFSGLTTREISRA